VGRRPAGPLVPANEKEGERFNRKRSGGVFEYSLLRGKRKHVPPKTNCGLLAGRAGGNPGWKKADILIEESSFLSLVHEKKGRGHPPPRLRRV